jgi:isopenicillin N synthase-like dioxygenase
MHPLIRFKKATPIFLALALVLSASLALADDFKTTAGKEYKDVTVTRVEPDGIIVKTKSGISKLYFGELPREAQERFHYDPQTATAYSAQEAAQYEGYQKQQEEARHRQEEADTQNRANIAEQEAQQRAANAHAEALANQKGERQLEKALKKANERPDRSHGYTTVVKPLFGHTTVPHHKHE